MILYGLLHLPDYVFPAAMLVMGYPLEHQKQRKKPERCGLDDNVMENSYRQKNGKELRCMFEKETVAKGKTYEEV